MFALTIDPLSASGREDFGEGISCFLSYTRRWLFILVVVRKGKKKKKREKNVKLLMSCRLNASLSPYLWPDEKEIVAISGGRDRLHLQRSSAA